MNDPLTPGVSYEGKVMDGELHKPVWPDGGTMVTPAQELKDTMHNILLLIDDAYADKVDKTQGKYKPLIVVFGVPDWTKAPLVAPCDETERLLLDHCEGGRYPLDLGVFMRRFAFKAKYRVESGTGKTFANGKMAGLGWGDFRKHMWERKTKLDRMYYESHYLPGKVFAVPQHYVLDDEEYQYVMSVVNEVNQYVASRQGNAAYPHLHIKYVDMAALIESEWPGSSKALLGNSKFSLDQFHPSCEGQRWILDHVLDTLQDTSQLPEQHPLHGYTLPALPGL